MPESPARTVPESVGLLSQALPALLSGTAPPRLPVGADGQLMKTRAVRDFFDYYLSAQQDLPPASLDEAVRREIAAQLDGSPAQVEALDLWSRYLRYRDASRHAMRPQPAAASIDDSPQFTPDFAAIETALAERESIARETLGNAWHGAFFGSDRARAHYDLERMRIAHDAGLTAEQKAARLQALDQMTPLDVRAALERERRTQATMDTIAELGSRRLPPEQLQALATQAVGAEAAERIVRMRHDDDAWRAKYDAYAEQRARIEAAGSSPAEREAHATQLRERLFANAGERLRAALLDAQLDQ